MNKHKSRERRIKSEKNYKVQQKRKREERQQRKHRKYPVDGNYQYGKKHASSNSDTDQEQKLERKRRRKERRSQKYKDDTYHIYDRRGFANETDVHRSQPLIHGREIGRSKRSESDEDDISFKCVEEAKQLIAKLEKEKIVGSNNCTI